MTAGIITMISQLYPRAVLLEVSESPRFLLTIRRTVLFNTIGVKRVLAIWTGGVRSTSLDALKLVHLIFSVGNYSKVRQVVISWVTVNVVNLHTIWYLAYKNLVDKSGDKICSLLARLGTKSNGLVAFLVGLLFELPKWSTISCKNLAVFSRKIFATLQKSYSFHLLIVPQAVITVKGRY